MRRALSRENEWLVAPAAFPLDDVSHARHGVGILAVELHPGDEPGVDDNAAQRREAQRVRQGAHPLDILADQAYVSRKMGVSGGWKLRYQKGDKRGGSRPREGCDSQTEQAGITVFFITAFFEALRGKAPTPLSHFTRFISLDPSRNGVRLD